MSITFKPEGSMDLDPVKLSEFALSVLQRPTTHISGVEASSFVGLLYFLEQIRTGNLIVTHAENNRLP